ncbi:Asp-tRNA(Asn)/Glu-tRNA(Gln) amidotransferase subunit GatA, partial [Candidatus Falkowbacteria bacterium]|nr:Asp-tRNA(Asn)/Glu-tRNA(Gln) amidotransferase subunit GatA [Candidatus Falkowbacteria bacterium]
LTPTAPHTAFKIGDQSSDPLKMYLEDIFVTGASLSGLPAIAIPCGQVQGLPVGMQLIGRAFDETTLLAVAHQYQEVTDFHKQKPKL